MQTLPHSLSPCWLFLEKTVLGVWAQPDVEMPLGQEGKGTTSWHTGLEAQPGLWKKGEDRRGKRV